VHSPSPPASAAIPTRERLIVALDVPDADAAKVLVRRLGDEVLFYKIGLELAASPRYFELLAWLLEQNKRVFADLKLYDVPATVAAAVRQISRTGAAFLTVHGDRAIVEAAVAEKGTSLRILAVTVLTSLDQQDLRQMGITTGIGALVKLRASQAIAAGCDGVIASGLEAGRLRTSLGAGPLIVTPGIRSAGERPPDDQKRVVSARRALLDGADYVVVGRPIRNAEDPRAAAAALQSEIAGALDE
jgi:orotidine-5'-phosphate decarboxylase